MGANESLLCSKYEINNLESESHVKSDVLNEQDNKYAEYKN
jgi:hypothetical protein